MLTKTPVSAKPFCVMAHKRGNMKPCYCCCCRRCLADQPMYTKHKRTKINNRVERACLPRRSSFHPNRRQLVPKEQYGKFPLYPHGWFSKRLLTTRARSSGTLLTRSTSWSCVNYTVSEHLSAHTCEPPALSRIQGLGKATLSLSLSLFRSLSLPYRRSR